MHQPTACNIVVACLFQLLLKHGIELVSQSLNGQVGIILSIDFFFLNLVDFAVYDEKKKLLTGQLRKYPEKLIIYCKDLRVFNFCLRYTKEEEVKRVSIGTSFVFFFLPF